MHISNHRRYPKLQSDQDLEEAKKSAVEILIVRMKQAEEARQISFKGVDLTKEQQSQQESIARRRIGLLQHMLEIRDIQKDQFSIDTLDKAIQSHNSRKNPEPEQGDNSYQHR